MCILTILDKLNLRDFLYIRKFKYDQSGTHV